MTLVGWSTVLVLAGCARTNHAERLIADLRSADPAVRLNAAEKLRELRDPKALEPLIAALEDEDAAVRFQPAAALGEFGDPRAAPPLIGALKDRDKDVRWTATFALRNLGPSAVGSLTNALRRSQPSVRVSAGAALREIRDAKAVGPFVAMLERGSQEMAEAFLDCGNPTLRQAAERWARAHGYQKVTQGHTAGSATGWGPAR